MNKIFLKCVKVFCEAGLAAVLAMFGISLSGCTNPRFAESIHEYSF